MSLSLRVILIEAFRDLRSSSHSEDGYPFGLIGKLTVKKYRNLSTDGYFQRSKNVRVIELKRLDCSETGVRKRIAMAYSE